jgi:hypothetical protein
MEEVRHVMGTMNTHMNGVRNYEWGLVQPNPELHQKQWRVFQCTLVLFSVSFYLISADIVVII